MPEETDKVQIEGRKAVRDMRNKAILSRDVTAREAYLRRRNLRRRRVQEVLQLRMQADIQNSELVELKQQVAELTKLVKEQFSVKKKTSRRKKSEDS